MVRIDNSIGEVIVSTSCFREFPTLAEMVRCMVELGIWNVEMSWAPPLSSGEIEEVISIGASLNVHNYFPQAETPFVLNLGSSDEWTLDRSREMAQSNIGLSARLGAGFYGVHAAYGAHIEVETLGRGLRFGPPEKPETIDEIMVDSLRGLCDYAATRGVWIALENHPVAARNLVGGVNTLLPYSGPGELLKLLAKVDRGNLGILLDLGHLKVTAETLGFERDAYIDSVADFIVAFHVSDNDGVEDRNWPLSDNCWALDVLRDPRFLQLPKVIEVNFASVDMAREHRDWLVDALGSEDS